MYLYTGGSSGGKDVLMCPIRAEEDGPALPPGLFAILNGATFFYYVPCLLLFAALWKYCGDGGREFLVKLIWGPEQSADTAEIAEKIGVGVAAAVGILNSATNMILAAVAEQCGVPAANAFIALNVLVFLVNAVACIQVSIVYYGSLNKCLEAAKE